MMKKRSRRKSKSMEMTRMLKTVMGKIAAVLWIKISRKVRDLVMKMMRLNHAYERTCSSLLKVSSYRSHFLFKT